MATVRLENVEPTRVHDLARFLELLELVGIYADSDFPITVIGSRLAITAQIASDAMTLPTEDESQD